MLKKLLIIVIFNIMFSEDRNFPEFNIIVNDNPYPANLFIHLMSSESDRYMAILDSNLTEKWYVNSGPMGLDFKVNNDHLTYFHKQGAYFIILDELMNEVDTVSCLNHATDYHDMRFLNNGNYILQAYDSLEVDMSQIVENGHPEAIIFSQLIIQEFNQNHELLFEWEAWDHLDISEYTNLNLTQEQITWMHGNSIEVDYDENLILSNRRSSEILKINRNSGSVIWRFGGPQNEFTIINDPLNGFTKQHDARRLENGNLMIFDNGNEHSTPISRVLEYEIDEINKTATLIWEYTHPQNYCGLAMGSAQRLINGNTLINWGTLMGEINGSVITEVDYEKNILLELHFPVHNNYKVRKEEWDFEISLLAGDSNLDNLINILDIIYLSNEILFNQQPLNMLSLFKLDLDKNGELNILDITNMVAVIMSA